MASVLRSLKRDPSLYPLVFAVGAGVVGAASFSFYYLSRQPDVVFRRSGDKEPWNRVEQGYNSKLYSPNKAFWDSRAEMPHPRAMFMGQDSPSLSDQAALAKAKAIRAAKEKDMKNNGEIGKSVMEESIEGRGGKYGGGSKETSIEH